MNELKTGIGGYLRLDLPDRRWIWVDRPALTHVKDEANDDEKEHQLVELENRFKRVHCGPKERIERYF